MSNEEYANYDYQTTTVPLKTEYGVTIGTETKSTYKLCTNDCVYKNNWNELKKRVKKQREIGIEQEHSITVHVCDLFLNEMKELENRKV